MKNLLFFFSLIMTSTLIHAQEVMIPDSIFKKMLLNCNICATYFDGSKGNVDKNKNGKIEANEAESVIELNLEPLFVTFDQDGELHQGGEIQNLGGINSFKNLQALKCPYNKITSLDLIGLSNLKILDCKYNKLTSLIIRGMNKLTNLSCYNNQLTTLDIKELDSLLELNCGKNNISSLNLEKNVKLNDLYCSGNKLTSIDPISLPNLYYLNCSDNQLSELIVNKWPKLGVLNCNNNKLKTIDLSTLKNLLHLSCSFNELSKLNVKFNHSFLYSDLECNNNKITELKIQGKLVVLNCSNNLLESLDFSDCEINFLAPASLYGLINIGQNPLKYINLKNSNYDDFSPNPNIPKNIILPQSLKYICCDVNEIEYLKEKFEKAINGTIEVNSYCSFTPGGKFYAIKGQAKYGGENSNCQGADAIAFPNLKLNITDNTNTGTLITNNQGTFEIPVQEGSHTITPILEFSEFFNITPTSFKATFPNTSDTIIQNFCITPKVSVSNVIIEIVPVTVARPGFEATYKIIITNKGTKTENGSLNFNFDNNILKLISSSLTPESVNGGIMNWKFENLKPFGSIEIIVVLKVNSPMDIPAINAGENFNLTASILNNKKIIIITVVGAYDPNEKTCLQGNQLRTEVIGKYVDYLVRFENTGNYFAENVVIKDIIDTSRFQVNSLEVVNSSHKMVTRINKNVVEFIFEDIKLPFPPDDKRHGYVLFKIKTKDNIKLGDSLKNEASIYFDYNFPIKTNRFESIVRNPSSTNNESIIEASIYPNPVKDILTIKSGHIIKTAEIYNVQGKLMEAIINPSENIRLSHLINGTYVIKLHSKDGVYTSRFIKM